MRIIGAGIVFLSFIVMGILQTRDEAHRIRCLSDISNALTLLSAELQSRRPPMKDLLEWASLNSEGEAKSFFNCLTDNLSRLGEISFPSLWEEAAENSLRSLNPADLKDLESIGKILGRTELSAQIAALNSCERSLRIKLENDEIRYRERKKLNLGIPATLGALFCILLL